MKTQKKLIKELIKESLENQVNESGGMRLPMAGGIGGGDGYQGSPRKNRFRMHGYSGQPYGADSYVGGSMLMGRIVGEEPEYDEEELCGEEDNIEAIRGKIPSIGASKPRKGAFNKRNSLIELYSSEFLNETSDKDLESEEILTYPHEYSEYIIPYVEKITESNKQIVDEDEDEEDNEEEIEETSTVANISGYSAPMSGPSNPKNFYGKMKKAYHGDFLIDPMQYVKSARKFKK